jgi:hypothetical protein
MYVLKDLFLLLAVRCLDPRPACIQFRSFRLPRQLTPDGLVRHAVLLLLHVYLVVATINCTTLRCILLLFVSSSNEDGAHCDKYNPESHADRDADFGYWAHTTRRGGCG